MQLKITIKMDNAAFDDCEGDEAARILREFADSLKGVGQAPRGAARLFDSNGNPAGEAKVTR